MAELLGLIGFGSFLTVSAVVGVRLLLLARRTRRLPELAIGLNFVLAGLIGYGLLIAAESLRVVPPPYDGWALARRRHGDVARLPARSASSPTSVFRPDDRRAPRSRSARSRSGSHSACRLLVPPRREGAGRPRRLARPLGAEPRPPRRVRVVELGAAPLPRDSSAAARRWGSATR